MKIHLPAERTEVLRAIGTGDVRQWENRILRTALEQKEDDNNNDNDDKNEVSRDHMSSVLIPCKERSNEAEKTNNWGSFMWSAWLSTSSSFLWSSTTSSSSCLTNKKKKDNGDAQFSDFSGREFHHLMRLVQRSLTGRKRKKENNGMNVSSPAQVQSPPSSTNTSTTTASITSFSGWMYWNEDLLTTLSSLLVFHGNVPAVGRFVSVILSSYVMTALFRRCRGDCHSDTVEAAKEKEDKGESHIRLIQSDSFRSLLSRLACIYFPLWHKLKGRRNSSAREKNKKNNGDMKIPDILFYSHSLPLPQMHRNILTVWSRMKSDGHAPHSESPELPSRIIQAMFSQVNTLDLDTELLLLLQCSNAKEECKKLESTRKAIALGDEKKKDGNSGDEIKDEKKREEKNKLFELEHLQEIVVCIAVAELGRLALLFEDLYEPKEFPRPAHSHRREEVKENEQTEKEESDDGGKSCIDFLSCVRRCTDFSSPEQMRDIAMILLSTREEWQRQKQDEEKEKAHPSGNGDNCAAKEYSSKERGNHHWMTMVGCHVLKIIYQTSGNLLLASLFNSAKQGDSCCSCVHWMYQENDLYYLNLLLMSGCIAGEELPSIFFPFTSQLTQLVLSHALQKEGIECTYSRNRNINIDDTTANNNNNSGTEKEGLNKKTTSTTKREGIHSAAHTLCMTTFKFVRYGCKHGNLILKNKHISWLSTLLREQLGRWEKCLRHVVLFMPQTTTMTTTTTRQVSFSECANTNLKFGQGSLPRESTLPYLYWHTKVLLEHLYVFRDVFTASSACWNVSDISPFCTVMEELGRVLHMVCWIDMKKKLSSSPSSFSRKPDGKVDADENEFVSFVFPFPVLADTGRRFFIGAMIIYVVSIAADTLLSFHKWINNSNNNNNNCNNDTSEENNSSTVCVSCFSGEATGNYVISSEKSSPKTDENNNTASHSLHVWKNDFILTVLLPPINRVLQCIPLCTPEESMLPALLCLHQFIEMEHVSCAYKNKTCDVCEKTCELVGRKGRVCIHRHSLHPMKISTLSSFPSFSETFHISMGVMSLANSVQDALLVLLLLPRRSLVHCAINVNLGSLTRTPQKEEEEEKNKENTTSLAFFNVPSVSDDVLLTVLEGFVLNVPWVSWASQSSNNNNIIISSSSSPAPPPLFHTNYMMMIIWFLFSSHLMSFHYYTRGGGGKNKEDEKIISERICCAMFGLIDSLFRAMDDVVFWRSSIREEMRLRRQEEEKEGGQNRSKHEGMFSYFSLYWDGLWINPLTFFSRQESSAEQKRKMESQTVDTYVDYYHELIYQNIFYTFLILYTLERKLRLHNDNHCLDDTTKKMYSMPSLSLERLARHSLENLVSDSYIPASFHFTPLSALSSDVLSLYTSPLSSLSLRGIVGMGGARNIFVPFQYAFSSVISQTSQLSNAWSQREEEENKTLSSAGTLLLHEAYVLVRTMTMIASLTQYNAHEGEKKIFSTGSDVEEPVFILHPAALSFSQWRKLCFAFHILRQAEATHKIISALYCRKEILQCLYNMGNVESTFSSLHRKPGGEEEEESKHICFACCTHAECEQYLRSYIEAGLPYINRSRMFVLIRRATTREESNALFVVLLMLRRAFNNFYTLSDTSKEIYKKTKEEEQDEGRRKKYSSFPIRRSRRESERALLLHISAFAFGVRPLKCAEELLR